MERRKKLSEDGEILHNSKTDPLGMYTGNPDVPYEKPVQDADDL